MPSFSSWREVNITKSESTASNLQATWDTVWPDPRFRNLFIFNSYQLCPANMLLVDAMAERDYFSTYTHVTHSKTTHQRMTPPLQTCILIQCQIV